MSVFYSAPEARLSEGLTFNPDNNTMLWCDIYAGIIHRVFLDSKKHESVSTNDHVGCLFRTANPNTILFGGKSGISECDFETKGVKPILRYDSNPELKNLENLRTNDGNVDSEGRIWVGLMNTFGQDLKPEGYVLRIDLDTSEIEIMREKMLIPNSVNWYKNDTFIVDSLNFQILKFPHGDMANPQQFINVLKFNPGVASPEPDGGCFDTDGNYYSAVWSTGKVQKFSPQGQLVQEWKFPASRISCCAIAHNKLYATSANLTLDTPEYTVHAGDLGGAVFVIDLPYPVTPMNKNVCRYLIKNNNF